MTRLVACCRQGSLQRRKRRSRAAVAARRAAV